MRSVTTEPAPTLVRPIDAPVVPRRRLPPELSILGVMIGMMLLFEVLGWIFVGQSFIANPLRLKIMILQEAVIGIIAQSAYKLTKKSIGTDWLLWSIYAALLVVTIVTETENVAFFLAAGLLVWLVRSPRLRRRPATDSVTRSFGSSRKGSAPCRPFP